MKKDKKLKIVKDKKLSAVKLAAKPAAKQAAKPAAKQAAESDTKMVTIKGSKGHEYELKEGVCKSNSFYVVIEDKLAKDGTDKTTVLRNFANANQIVLSEQDAKLFKQQPEKAAEEVIHEYKGCDTLVIVAHGMEACYPGAEGRFAISSKGDQMKAADLIDIIKSLTNKMEQIKSIRLQMCYADSLKMGSETFLERVIRDVNKERKEKGKEKDLITFSAPKFLSAVLTDGTGRYADFTTEIDASEDVTSILKTARNKIFR